VDYSDKERLTAALKEKSTHTVLSFIQLLSDPEDVSQKNLIDACVAAGVRRFAPSEWGSRGVEHLPWWSGKANIRKHLEDINRYEKVHRISPIQ